MMNSLPNEGVVDKIIEHYDVVVSDGVAQMTLLINNMEELMKDVVDLNRANSELHIRLAEANHRIEELVSAQSANSIQVNQVANEGILQSAQVDISHLKSKVDTLERENAIYRAEIKRISHKLGSSIAEAKDQQQHEHSHQL